MDSSNLKNLMNNNYSNLSHNEVLNIELNLNSSSLSQIQNINESQLNNNQLNCETERETKIFQVKSKGQIKSSIDFENLKMKHCNKIRTIIFQNEKLNSIYHPKNDSHGFYILRNKKGLFYLSNFINKNFPEKEKIQQKKKLIVKEETEKFIEKLNQTIDINQIQEKIKYHFIFKIILYLFIILSISVISFLFFNFLISFLSSILKENLDSNFDKKISEFLKFCYFILSTCIIYLCHRLIKFLRKKEKFLIFLHINNHKNLVEEEIEKMNENVLQKYNMKASLSNTLDYIQIFYDQQIKYEIEFHNDS